MCSGRLLYSTGDTRGAIKIFLALLRWSSAPSSIVNREVGDRQESVDSDKVYLEDFAVALAVGVCRRFMAVSLPIVFLAFEIDS